MVVGHAAEDQKQIWKSSWWKKLSWTSPHDVLQLWLINIVYRKLVKNNKGRGGKGKRGLKEKGGLLEGELIWERGGLMEDLQYGWPKENGFFWPEIGYRFWARNQVSLKFVLPGRKAWNWVCFHSFDFWEKRFKSQKENTVCQIFLEEYPTGQGNLPCSQYSFFLQVH